MLGDAKTFFVFEMFPSAETGQQRRRTNSEDELGAHSYGSLQVICKILTKPDAIHAVRHRFPNLALSAHTRCGEAVSYFRLSPSTTFTRGGVICKL